MNRQRNNHGMTLLETMVFVALWGLLAVTTMAALSQSSITCSRAADRSDMVMIAQAEIERLRHVPAEELIEGEQELRREEWPQDVAAKIETRLRPDGTWLLDVLVTRATLEGVQPVRLTTLRLGDAS
ncbi:hypothetical protein KQI84_18945 [bacterium]|nr:hypothetical protein [bacterium]